MNTQIFFRRIYRALKLDGDLYEEVKANGVAGWQPILVVALVSLANSLGFGIVKGFGWMAGCYIWIILLALLGTALLWLMLSFLTYLLGTKVFGRQSIKVKFRKVLCTTGFSVSPGLLGFFLWIPVIGGYIWLGIILCTIVSAAFSIKHVLGSGPTRAITIYLGSSVLSIIILAAISGLAIALFVNGTFTPKDSFDNALNAKVKQTRFSYAGWEVKALANSVEQCFLRYNKSDAIKTVTDYFSSNERPAYLKATVEKILETQIIETLREEGIDIFPPVKLELGKLPNLLVVSPRDRIVSLREIFLDPNLSLQTKEKIENSVDGLNVSSLVVPIGGFAGVYPSYVTNNESLQSTLSAVAEEWVHQYLAFKPLGFRYVLDLLGISRNYDVAMINETVAGIVSDEIASILIEKYYPDFQESPTPASQEFSQEMAAIRQQVDDLLQQGEIEAAEEFMHVKQIYLQEQGYYIRKLNQAYFAWYGTYAYEPGFVSPIGQELIQLKAGSSSLKEFLDSVSAMTSAQDLANFIGN
jgi:hypothetical protein